MKKLLTAFFSLCLALSMAAPAFAYDYTIPEPGDPEYADDTSVDVVYTVDGGAASNEDKSKNAAVIPPAFGSPGAYALNTGEYLTPNLAPKAMTATDVTVGSGMIQYPVFPAATTPAVSATSNAATAFTEVTSDLYYSGGYLATLKIPAIGVNVKGNADLIHPQREQI